MKTNLIQDYKVFEGIYNQIMPLLVKENYQPLTTKDIMLNRIKAIQSKDQNEINFWLNQYLDTVDGLAYHNNELIIQPNSNLLLDINQDSRLNNGSLILNQEQFNELSKKYEVFNRNKIISDKRLTKQQVKEHPIWLKLAQDDKSLLNEYTDLIFSKAKEIYQYDENMGVYLPNDQENPAMHDWFLWDLVSRSFAGTRCDFYNARLFGVRAQNLEIILGKIVLDQGLNQEELRKAIEPYKKAKV
ncbi:MAG: hypothetical protein NT139_00985 [Candidatus Woesearchaeota archaeon]|nr:hypothetical protein [Candidatus Woesearchaeota archaeon]